MTLPKLPEPFDYCYEWDGPYGTRKFSTSPHNGRKADRTVSLYTREQVEAIRTETVELCARVCAKVRKGVFPEDAILALLNTEDVHLTARSGLPPTGDTA